MTSAATRAAGGSGRPARIGTWSIRLVALLLAASVGAGCAKARAAGVPEAPPLVVPQPPPRVLAPIEEEEPLAANPAGPDTSVASAPRIQPAAQRPAPRARAAEPGGEASTTPAAASPAPPAAEASRELRTAPSSREAVPDQQRIQGLIDRAAQDLDRVDYRKLPAAGREQYDISKRYLKEATDDLRDRNFLRAQESADKAARIAAALLAMR